MRKPATRFEDLVVWQKTHLFVLTTYRLSWTFPRSETNSQVVLNSVYLSSKPDFKIEKYTLLSDLSIIRSSLSLITVRLREKSNFVVIPAMLLAGIQSDSFENDSWTPVKTIPG